IIINIIVFLIGYFVVHVFWFVFILTGPTLIIGLIDMFQTKNTIIRNFPAFGHMRYILKNIAPEIHQYFVEDNTDGKPFNEIQRDFVNQRADKEDLGTHPFGTELDLDNKEFDWSPHSIYAKDMMEEPPRVKFGTDQCNKPYEAALLNISAMSFG